MISAFDVRYADNGSAMAAAVVFKDFKDAAPVSCYRKKIDGVQPYVPGAFYKRELPCILSLLSDIREPIDTIIIDGYVFLGDRPGLGAYLKEKIEKSITPIGVAKSYFKGSRGIKVFRGKSRKPLHVTASGMDPVEAAQRISSMHGKHRIPTLLKTADRLTRKTDPLCRRID